MIDHSKYFQFSLTKQQIAAFEGLVSFVKGDLKVFILKGYAGTGKTTLMSGLIKWLNEEKRQNVLLATTGRASKILSNKSKAKSATIHSCIYAFNRINQDLEQVSKQGIDKSGQISLMFDLKPLRSEKETIYIIDEASMISDESKSAKSITKFGSGDLLGDLFSYDRMGKFIFVGDPCQLPPIGQANSPALTHSRIEEKYSLKSSGYELTDIVRQSNESGIIKAASEIRKLYYENPPIQWAKLPLRNFNNIVIHKSTNALLQHYIKELRENGYEDSTIICRANKRCSELNKIIRDSIYTTAPTLVVGDLIMITNNNSLSNLVNGDHVTIKSIGESKIKCNLSFVDVEVLEPITKRILKTYLIENILYSGKPDIDVTQQQELIVDFFIRMKAKGLEQDDDEFKEEMLKDPYLNALRGVYGYALTCHKCQGGEWDNVYLFLDNKIQGMPRPEIYQWWYTAVTRARKTLHVAENWFII